MLNLPLSAPARYTRSRVEARILDIPITDGDIVLEVQRGQSRAVPVAVSVIERLSEVHYSSDEASDRNFVPDAHKPIVRLRVQRFTKLNQKARNAAVWFDIQGLRKELTGDIDFRVRSMSHPLNTFEPTTLADLVLLSDRALELYAGVAWEGFEMKSEEQR